MFFSLSDLFPIEPAFTNSYKKQALFSFSRKLFLLRNKTKDITFLSDHYHKFSTQKEKDPGADVSTRGSLS